MITIREVRLIELDKSDTKEFQSPMNSNEIFLILTYSRFIHVFKPDSPTLPLNRPGIESRPFAPQKFSYGGSFLSVSLSSFGNM